ncbi:MAG: hypothetical protein ACPIOQ_35375 [Promethearchaeia archaeon]
MSASGSSGGETAPVSDSSAMTGMETIAHRMPTGTHVENDAPASGVATVGIVSGGSVPGMVALGKTKRTTGGNRQRPPPPGLCAAGKDGAGKAVRTGSTL